MPTARRHRIGLPHALTRSRPIATTFLSTIASEYVKDVKTLGVELRKEREDYNQAIKDRDTGKMNLAERKFRELSQTWPYYIDQDRVPLPYPINVTTIARPYPPYPVLSKINMKDRWKIISTALLARRGVGKRRRLEGIIPKINAVMDTDMFTSTLRKYLNPKPYSSPPDYPRGSSEAYDAEFEEYVDPDVRQVTPPVNIRPIRYGQTRTRGAYDRPPEGSETDTDVVGPLPDYSPPDYELQGGKSRRRKRKSHRLKTRKHRSRRH